MQKPKISIIVAVSRNLAIGKDNRLLFNLPDDLKRFKRITRGHAVVMGQKTFESIGRPLPERTNIVISDKLDYTTAGAIVVHSIDEAIRQAQMPERSDQRLNLKSEERFNLKDRDEIFIIGGGQIYRQFLPLADKLYLTLVDSDAEGDTFFPDWSKDFTKEVSREEHIDEKTRIKYAWITLER